MAPRPDNSLARSLGQFVGHIWKGVRADVSRNTREVGRTTDETTTTDATGRPVTLRRTTIDEIEIHTTRDTH
jgi:hypothetical protein